MKRERRERRMRRGTKWKHKEGIFSLSTCKKRRNEEIASADSINEESAASLSPSQTPDCILFEDGRGHHLLNRRNSLVCIWFQTHSVSLLPLPVLLYVCLLDCLYQLSAHALCFFLQVTTGGTGRKREEVEFLWREIQKLVMGGVFFVIFTLNLLDVSV